jgi:hypothetical protein
MCIHEPEAEIITSEAIEPGNPPIDEKKKRSPFRRESIKHLEVHTVATEEAKTSPQHSP